MTEREKKEICRGYADLIINKEQLTRELWKTEVGIKRLEGILIRNKIMMPTPPEEPSETDQYKDVHFYDGSKRGLIAALKNMQERFAFNFFRPQTVRFELPWELRNFEDWKMLRREWEALYHEAEKRFNERKD